MLLFAHLAKTFGPVSHCKLGGSNIVFIDDPELIREILVTQASSFIQERTRIGPPDPRFYLPSIASGQ
ncbi:MAG: hypothetical protein ACYCOR_13370 [Acidobacteriaceae bacterium]